MDNKQKKPKVQAAANAQTTTPQKVAPLKQTNNTSTDPIITTAEAGAEDLEAKVKQLSDKIDKWIEKQHSEQRNIFIGVLFAVVLITASVAAEVIMFNAHYNDNLSDIQKQEQQDYRSLRDAIDQNRDTTNQQLFNLKLNANQTATQ